MARNMNTLILAAFVFGLVLLAYLLIYPRVVQGDFVRLLWADVVLSIFSLAVVGTTFWNSGTTFSFGLFETNWLAATLLLFVIFESYFFPRYCRQFGIKPFGD